MTATVLEDPFKRLARRSVNGWEAERHFTVDFSADTNAEEAMFLACEAAGIPQRWSSHPYNPWLFVFDIQATPINALYYDVVVYYAVPEAIKALTRTTAPDDVSPLNYPWRIRYDPIPSQEEIDRDIYGNAIVNSALESFDPPLVEDVYDMLITVERNEAAFPEDLAAAYYGVVNSDTWRGYAPRTCRCVGISAESARAATLDYWTVTYQIAVRKDTWDRVLNDKGFREYVEDNDEGKPGFRNIKDEDGNPVSEPVYLDGYGLRLAAGSPIVKLTYETKKALPFSVLTLNF